eukprot:4363113-Lingulodinium_polyedra.AAC.1
MPPSFMSLFFIRPFFTSNRFLIPPSPLPAALRKILRFLLDLALPPVLEVAPGAAYVAELNQSVSLGHLGLVRA